MSDVHILFLFLKRCFSSFRSSLSEAVAAAEFQNFPGPDSENEPILSPFETQDTLGTGDSSSIGTPVLPDLINDVEERFDEGVGEGGDGHSRVGDNDDYGYDQGEAQDQAL